MQPVSEYIVRQILWRITRYADDEAYARGDPYAVSDIPTNLGLNEGLQESNKLLTGQGGTHYGNANARIGVGDSATAEGATQTDLQAATNKLYKAVEATYPQTSGQTLTWRAVFTGAEANYAWNEFSVDNGAAAGKNLNRKVSAQGTKTSGQTWTIDLQITFA